MSVLITEAGILDTFQDNGRYGYGASGINPGGAMDIIAANIANYLVGNNENEAVIELHYPAASLFFRQSVLIALSGADFSPCVNEQPVAINTPIFIPAGSKLEFKKMKRGARCYLAVHGGFTLNKWLNSYCTNLKAKAGGLNGRPLQENDIIDINFPFFMAAKTATRLLPWQADVSALYNNEKLIRIIKGKEYDLLTDCSETIIEGNTFTVSAQSDRMGYRMNGTPLQLIEPLEMISSAVTRGTIQLLPTGQLIILMADHQTTGGYPRIGHIISADFPLLAQTQLNTPIRFKLVSLDEAEQVLLQTQHHLQQIKNACSFRLQQYLQQHGIYRS